MTPDTTDPDGWRHGLRFDGADGSHWQLPVVSPCALGRRLDGSVVVLDLKNGATLVSGRGEVVWRSSFPSCGAIEGMAVGWDGAVSFTCGYSVLKLAPDGTFLWQKWPFGDEALRGPWVDRAGVLYVAGGGRVAALTPDGESRWTLSTGFNRATSRLAWNAAGHLVFDTGMAQRHTDPGKTNGLRIYHPHEPRELFEVARDGSVVRREIHEQSPPPGGWPPVLPAPEDGSHRTAEPSSAREGGAP